MFPVYSVHDHDLIGKVGMRGEICDCSYLGSRNVEEFREEMRGRLGLVSSGEVEVDAFE